MIGVLLLAAGMLLWQLGDRSLEDWDEAIYAQISKEFLATEDWLTPHYRGRPWFEKPPLLPWLTAGIFRVLGVSEFSARAASALFGIGLVWITFRIAAAIHGRAVAATAALILLASAHFVIQARFGTIDVALTFFLYAAIYAYLRVIDGAPKFWYLFWLLAALAAMAKGVAAAVVVVAVLASLLLRRRFLATVRSSEFRRALVPAGLVLLPWHAAMLVGHGKAFATHYIGRHVLARSLGALEGNAGDALYYLRVLDNLFFPWGYLVPFAVLAAGIRARRHGDEQRTSPARDGEQLLVVFAATVLLLYTLVQTKLPWYVVPMYPALAILVAAMMVEAFERRPLAWPGLGVAGGAALAALRHSWWLAGLVAGLGLALIAVGALAGRRAVGGGFLALVCAVLFASGLAQVAPLYAPNDAPFAALARSPDVRGGRGPLLVLGSAPTVVFYSDREVEEFDSIEELRRLPPGAQAREILVPKEFLDALRQDYEFVGIRTVGSVSYGLIRRIDRS